MGYLAQRKKYMRTNFVLKSLLLLLTVFSVAAFGDNALGYFCNNWRFQFYLLSAALAAAVRFALPFRNSSLAAASFSKTKLSFERISASTSASMSAR